MYVWMAFRERWSFLAMNDWLLFRSKYASTFPASLTESREPSGIVSWWHSKRRLNKNWSNRRNWIGLYLLFNDVPLLSAMIAYSAGNFQVLYRLGRLTWSRKLNNANLSGFTHSDSKNGLSIDCCLHFGIFPLFTLEFGPPLAKLDQIKWSALKLWTALYIVYIACRKNKTRCRGDLIS